MYLIYQKEKNKKTNVNIIKSATSESCFTIDALRKIATKWNETHPQMKIDFTTITTGKNIMECY